MYTAETFKGTFEGESMEQIAKDAAKVFFEQDQRNADDLISARYWDGNDTLWYMTDRCLSHFNDQVQRELDELWEDDASAADHERYVGSLELTGRI